MHDDIETYIDLGYKLFPCISNTKRPIIEGSFHKASNNKATITKWEKKYIGCNWGLATGTKSGIFLFDIDENHSDGASGLKSLNELIKQFGDLPKTVQVLSPNGGKHYWFKMPTDRPHLSSTSKDNPIADGIEIKADGGYMMVPPNYISGKEYKIQTKTGKQGDFYTWIPGHSIKDVPVADPPDWLIKLIRKTESEIHNLVLEKAGRPYSVTDKGNIKELNQPYWARLHQLIHIELFDPDEKNFYRYNTENGLYEIITDHTIKNEIAEYVFEMAKAQKNPDISDKRTNHFLDSTTQQLKIICEKKNAFKRDNKFIHFKNGVLHFKPDGKTDFTRFSPEYYAKNQRPFNYEPEAKCDRFVNELLKPAMSEDDILILQKYMGLCLLGNNIAQRFLILDGQPNRGKSRISKIIQAIVGAESVMQLRTQHLIDRFETYRFRDKNLLIGVDVPGDFLQDKGASVIKGLIGGDIFNAEQKGGTGSFPILGNFCIVINSNTRLQVTLDGDIEAWRRRLLIIRFETPIITKRIPEFDQVLLKDEGSGIINFALEGLKKIFNDFEQHGSIQIPENQQKIIDTLLSESDSVRYFLQEKITNIGTGNEYASNGLTSDDIVIAYSEFCPTMGWNPKPITIIHKDLAKFMLEMFNTVKSTNIIGKDGKKQRGYTNVKFKEDNIEKNDEKIIEKDSELFDYHNTDTEIINEY